VNCADLAEVRYKVSRGGGFDETGDLITTANRWGMDPSNRMFHTGIRCARSAPVPESSGKQPGGGGTASGEACAKKPCQSENGIPLCGSVHDGCGGMMECGDTCSSHKDGWSCDGSIGSCVGGPSCTKRTCLPAGARPLCGLIDDGCGRMMDCPTDCLIAGTGWTCGPAQVCVPGPNCVRAGCTPTPLSSIYRCGRIDDGCGGTLECGSCPAESGANCGLPRSAVQSCGCGAVGQACCIASVCAERALCDGKMCQPLGGSGQTLSLGYCIGPAC
jgi:hypothetical protein